MLIYLDFDGTCCEHRYPSIGKYNEGCVEVISKLQDAGHQIVLNTYRIECMDNTFHEAMEYLATLNFSKPIEKFTHEKITPDHWKPEGAKFLFIDDIAIGIPITISNGHLVVNWHEVDAQLDKYGFYKKT